MATPEGLVVDVVYAAADWPIGSVAVSACGECELVAHPSASLRHGTDGVAGVVIPRVPRGDGCDRGT
jgi:hypothetical protein